MKKFICIISVFTLILSLCACGNKENTPDNSQDVSQITEEAVDEGGIKEVETSKTLKVYSYEEFKKFMQEKDYEIYLDNQPNYLAMQSNRQVQANYYSRSTPETFKTAVYDSIMNNQFNNFTNDEVSVIHETGKNYESYSATSPEGFRFVIFFETTAIEVTAISGSEAKASDLVKALGF